MEIRYNMKEINFFRFKRDKKRYFLMYTFDFVKRNVKPSIKISLLSFRFFRKNGETVVAGGKGISQSSPY